MTDRIYSKFLIKDFDSTQRTFSGIATTVSTDRQQDIVEPLGGIFRLPLVMLWQHGKGSITDPIGWITSARPSASEIRIEGKMAIPKPDYPSGLRDDLDKAWVMVRDGLVRGLSIGFQPLEWEPIRGTSGNRYTKWSWLELSPVAIAANEEASILNIKRFDALNSAGAILRSSGVAKRGVVRLRKPDSVVRLRNVPGPARPARSQVVRLRGSR